MNLTSSIGVLKSKEPLSLCDSCST